MIFEKAKAEIDTDFLVLFEEAKMYPDLLTEKYLKYLATDAYTSNATIYTGDQIPNVQMDFKRASM